MLWIGARLAVVLGLVFAGRPARAEINMAASVEWATADADLVVRGVVTSVQSFRGRGQPSWHHVTLRVLETLKGPRRLRRQRQVRIVLPWLHWIQPDVWKRQRTELLLFLVRSQRRAKAHRGYLRQPWALQRAHGSGSSVVCLSGGCRGPAGRGIYTMDFRVLRRRADILHATGAAARATARARKPKMHRVDVPAGTPAYRALWGGSTVWLYVPADARLVKQGFRWLRSKSVHRRLEGARALGTLRTRATERKLRQLLKDTSFWVESSGAQSIPIRTRVYPVRAAAYKALRSWGLQVPKPVTRVRIR